jgi:hypothetical protein
MLNRNRFHQQPDARQPADVRFTELRVEPWPDGKRVRVHVSLTPFLQNPNLDAVITDSTDQEVAHSSIIEIVDVRFVFTMHIRSHPVRGLYNLTARLGYEDLGIVEERSISFETEETGDDSTAQ